ncbi:MAG: DUF4336 domain-containing protein [Myxococcota bacterium]
MHERKPEPIAEDVFELSGEVRMIAGWYLPLRTVVLKLGDSLWVHSPVALDEAVAERIDALGSVRWLVAPSNLHHLFIGDWKRRWPDATMIGARGLLRKRPDLTFDATLDSAELEWPGVEHVYIEGAARLGETVFFHRPSRSLVCTDLMFNLHANNTRGFLTPWILRMTGAYGRPAQSRLLRSVTKDRGRARSSLERVLEWPIERVLMAHGDVVDSDAKDILRSSCHWMLSGDSKHEVTA